MGQSQVDADLGAGLGERVIARLLVSFPPKVALSWLVNSSKGVSPRRMR